MANLQYPVIIAASDKFVALCELGKRLNLAEKRQIMTTLVELLPDEVMPLLAEKWSMTGYDGMFSAETSQSKSALINNAVQLHRYKGTPYSIREVLRKLGYGEVEIDEGLILRDYSSNQSVAAIPQDEKWAYYGIKLSRPITKDQAEEIKKVLRNYAPARCVLGILDYKSAPLLYNNKATYNGAYNHGSI
ncbi:tail fiber protein [Gallibacterium salpingitidis]|uniref:Tail fiber protein n=1 Tax=Gallibacterium salpingitidis TaxID=505341 RepID=A0AB36DZT1_9PAST|nr:phage tail protein [Gallibacterium salpingitidis]OBX06905.1 tail fiber protein [Gallibacterium salpingitidis]